MLMENGGSMFCPQCGSTQSDDLRFCKSCGANLLAVRKAVKSPESVEKFDWNKTWLAHMMRSPEEQVRTAAEIERLQGITPETKRRTEIKAGVITASVGVGVMITVFMIMQGIILGGFVPQAVAEILSRIWVAGVIPMLVGFALIFNGLFVAKRGEGLPPADLNRTDAPPAKELAEPASVSFLEPAPPRTNPLGSDVFSVTDETTQHLEEPIPVKRKN
jgi:hypothetical protein